MKTKLVPYLLAGFIAIAGSFTFNGAANANEIETKSFSEEQMPNEVREVVEIINSGQSKGNKKDGYTTKGNPNAKIYGESSSSNDGGFQTMAIIGQSKSNTKTFGYSSKGVSVINMTVGNPGFWNSLYQNKYDGWGYTSQNSGTYTPSKALATVTASATGVIPNISNSGSSWGLLNTTKQVGKDEATWSSRKYAMAYADDVRIQNLSNLTVKFEVKSELRYSAVGSRTTYNSVRFW